MKSTLNLTAELERVISEVVRCTGEFSHIDTSRLLVCVSTTRNGGVHGVHAKIHPLRFPGGARSIEVRRRKRACTCTIPTITDRGNDILYLIYFLIPRFLDMPLREKLITIFHELYHISPAFDGDIRRFPGRNYAHGSSTRRYNQLMGVMVDRYLEEASGPHIEFLRDDLAGHRAKHGAIVARKHQVPRLRIS